MTMAREISKELKEAIERFNKVLKKEQEGRKLECIPLEFASSKQSKNGKR
jgi:hypothetical protein